MTTFIIKYDGESATIEAATLSAAKVKATKLLKENDGALLFVCDQNGNDLSFKTVDRFGRGVWHDCSKPVEQEAVKTVVPVQQEAAPELCKFVVKVMMHEGLVYNRRVKASSLARVQSWTDKEYHNDPYDYILIETVDGELLSKKVNGSWIEEGQEPAQKPCFAIVNEIPDCGNATLSIARGIESIHTLLIGQDPERLIVLDGDIASKVEVSKEAGCSIVHTISNEICDDSYLISNLAAIQVLGWWTGREVESVGFIHTKNNQLVIVTEAQARWLDEKFFPLTKAGKR